jgi:hypothetical protein
VRSEAGKVRLTNSSAVAVVATNTAAIRHDNVNTAAIRRGGCWDGGRVGIVPGLFPQRSDVEGKLARMTQKKKMKKRIEVGHPVRVRGRKRQNYDG